MCPIFHCNWHIQTNVEVTVKKTVNQLHNYSTVLGAAIKCKPSPSKITQKYLMFGREFGFRGPFMMEKKYSIHYFNISD